MDYASLILTEVAAVNGVTKPLKWVMSQVLKHLKHRAELCLSLPQNMNDDPSGFGRPIPTDRVRWVLTIPAIWSESAKQFMRACAKAAGMADSADSVTLLFEPEAAAIAVHSECEMDVGDYYATLDCGGGTADLVWHEYLGKFEVCECRAPTGGPWGSRCIELAH